MAKEREISADNCIGAYLHCKECLKELPAGMSPREYGQYEVGFTPLGIQVWCKRHEINIVHIDFEGQKHPANMMAIK